MKFSYIFCMLLFVASSAISSSSLVSQKVEGDRNLSVVKDIEGNNRNLFVSKELGANKNPGTKEAPFKNIQKAIDVANKGDVIHIAEGNYYGLMNKGYLDLNKAVSLIGGYAKDFSDRDIVKYRTMVQPPNKASATSSVKRTIEIAVKNDPNALIVIDGIIFDKGEANSYHTTDGKPEGVLTGMLLHPPTKNSKDQFPTTTTPIIGGEASGTLIIQNCFFVNAPFYAIQMTHGEGEVKILNNVFVANALSAFSIGGGRAKSHSTKIEFAYNTVLFTWSRTKFLEDMGYGVRVMTKADYNIHHNIIGLNLFSGIDNTREDKEQLLAIDNNIFFLNKQADLVLPSGGGMFLNLRAEEFEDLEFESVENNTELADPKSFQDAINKEYLEGFLSLNYKETTDYDPNSPANTFRAAMGMNKQGTIRSSTSMFANKYPLEDIFKLVGVIDGFGAQKYK